MPQSVPSRMTTTVHLLQTPRRILVINVARIGDTLLIVPVLRALRQAYPEAEIVCLGHPKRIEVIAELPFIDRWAGITKRSAFLHGRFGKTFDLALVYGREPALIDYALRVARHVVAQRTGDSRRNHRLSASIEERYGEHAVPDRLRWLDVIGIPHGSRRLDYRATEQEIRWAANWLADHGGHGYPLVGFQVASFPTKSYRNWPMENFCSLAERILATHPQARLLIFGGKADTAPAAQLAHALGHQATSMAGKFSLRQTAALMRHLDLYVGVDTGPTHLAGALGIPMVAMYHCQHRGLHLAPLEHPAYLGVVEHPATDDAASTACSMAEIDVATVWEHVRQALAAPKEGA